MGEQYPISTQLRMGGGEDTYSKNVLPIESIIIF